MRSSSRQNEREKSEKRVLHPPQNGSEALPFVLASTWAWYRVRRVKGRGERAEEWREVSKVKEKGKREESTHLLPRRDLLVRSREQFGQLLRPLLLLPLPDLPLERRSLPSCIRTVLLQPQLSEDLRRGYVLTGCESPPLRCESLSGFRLELGVEFGEGRWEDVSRVTEDGSFESELLLSPEGILGCCP
jgi:hypothetical protein